MKTCPYCAEEIQDAAVVCKHCARIQPGTEGARLPASTPRFFSKSRDRNIEKPRCSRTSVQCCRGSAQIGVEIQHKDRLLTDPGTIEDVRAVENDVVPFDRADVLEQGCVTAFLGDSPRSPRPRDLPWLANWLRDGKIMARCR